SGPVDAVLRLGFRVVAEAGAVPRPVSHLPGCLGRGDAAPGGRVPGGLGRGDDGGTSQAFVLPAGDRAAHSGRGGPPAVETALYREAGPGLALRPVTHGPGGHAPFALVPKLNEKTGNGQPYWV